MKTNLRAALGSPLLILAMLFLLLLAASAAFATAITLSSVNAIGGTGLVTVNCPASPCSVTSVTWGLQAAAPFYVQSATVAWTPSFTGSAQVCVNIYDSTSTLKAGACLSSPQTVTQGSSTTTSFSFSPAVNPKDIYNVEVIIAQD
jgi:hypothetical protein